jgi:hypothetical protein
MPRRTTYRQEIRKVSARFFVAACVALLSGASAFAQAATPGTSVPADTAGRPRAAALAMGASKQEAGGAAGGAAKAMPGVRAQDGAGLATLTLEAALAEAQ